MKMTENQVALDYEISEAIRKIYVNEPEKLPAEVLMTLFTHGLYQYIAYSEDGEIHRDCVRVEAHDMVDTILNHIIQQVKNVEL